MHFIQLEVQDAYVIEQGNCILLLVSLLDPPFLKYLSWFCHRQCYSRQSFLHYLERSEPKQHPRNREHSVSAACTWGEQMFRLKLAMQKVLETRRT